MRLTSIKDVFTNQSTNADLKKSDIKCFVEFSRKCLRWSIFEDLAFIYIVIIGDAKDTKLSELLLIAESLYSIVSGCGWRLGVINERQKYFKGALDGCKLWHISNVCSKKCNFLYQGLISLEKVFRELSLVEEDTQSWL